MNRLPDRLILTLLGLVAGGVGAIVAGQPWWRTSTHAFTGNDLTDRLAQSLCLAILAGVGVTLLLGVWGRRLAGGLVTLLGIGVSFVAITRHAPTSAQLEQTLGVASVAGSGTGAHWLTLLAGIVSALVGVGFMVRAGAWQAASKRFERATPGGSTPVTDSLGAWKAMDAGHDPTDFDDNLSTTDPR